MDIKDVFIGKAQKYNCYQEGVSIDNNFKRKHSCKTCIRKHMSYPYTCVDGWPTGNLMLEWKDRGANCINWTDDKNCKVD